MEDTQIETMEELRSFLKGVGKHRFYVVSVAEKYLWIQQTLEKFGYLGLCKKEKGVVFAYLKKRTGYSRQQLSRLIEQYRYSGKIFLEKPRRYCFPRKYQEQDLYLLIKTDNLHGRLSGPATKKILEREYEVYGNQAYRRISQISVSHIYHLRKTQKYREQGLYYQKTQAVSCPIGERAVPRPEGKPGYLRVDTVHQGDQDQHKGVYYINTIDEVTQYQIMLCVPQISELYLSGPFVELFQQYPFEILGFHSDNGSEYINYQVAEMLQRLLIQQTKSRARHPNDNALVECKNGWVLRKQMGYGYIPAKRAQAIHTFFQQWLNPYVNFHRPCFFATVERDERGKQVKRYPYSLLMTPYEKLKSLPRATSYLQKGVSFQELDVFASQMSDNEFAQKMQQAKEKLRL